MNISLFLTNIREAFLSLKGNKLRAGLTVMIIAFGITAIVGVLTAIDSVEYSLRSTFSTMGSNSFQIVNRRSAIVIGHRRRIQRFPSIKYREAKLLVRRLREEGMVASIKVNLSFGAKIAYKSKKTTPNISIVGIDERFLETEAYQLSRGRFITLTDVLYGSKVAVIGSTVKEQLFPALDPVGKMILLGKKQYKIIGVLEERGTAFGSMGDKIVLVPISAGRKDFLRREPSYIINVSVPVIEELQSAIEKAVIIFRTIRRLKVKEADNFAISLSSSFVADLMENLRILTWSAVGISVITLLGAIVGLMNIMLVSVTERTKEIGIRKALGATPRAIATQFLVEALVIGQLGALLGTFIGIILGNIMSVLLESPFIVPWEWMLLAIVLCILVSLVAGVYPAKKAAKADPIEALRYE